MNKFNISNYSTEDFRATYSPEDNKLRLYADVRIDAQDWAIMKECGWSWAPKQELFVCYWSVNREDFCFSLAGDILPEELTMVERAEMKADRLLILAQKRSDQCVGYQLAANNLMMRLDNNQPILSGHHSQRKAEKIEKQVNRNIVKAHETADAVGYWVWRAKGVISHADYKNNPRTVHNRIKGLLKDLRDNQNVINEAAHNLNIIDRIDAMQDSEKRERMINNLSGFNFFYGAMRENSELEAEPKLLLMSDLCNNTINSRRRARLIGHTLNRLAYEQGQLSLVSVYDGAITPAVLQTFLRAHGADKPKATKSDYGFIAESDVCMPLHLASSCTMELEETEWRELMQSVGYEVPVKRTVAAKAPILNFKTELSIKWDRGYSHKMLTQVELTKEEHKRVGKDHTTTILSTCGEFRMRIGFVKTGVDKWGSPDFNWHSIFISDSKVHPTPDSMQAGQIALV